LLGEIVGEHGLPRAVGLNSACFNLARMAGPSLGGAVVGVAGADAAFLVNAASYLAVVVSLLALRAGQMFAAPVVPRRSGQLREALRYVVGNRDLTTALVVIGLVNMFALNLQVTVALMARQALRLSASGYGGLFAAVGIGSIIGALLAVVRAKGSLRIMLAATLMVGVLEMAAATAPSFGVLFGLLLAVGAAGLTVSTSSNTMAQLQATPEMRGRTMALYFMAASGGRPFGAAILGYLATEFGPRWSMAGAGAAATVTALAATGIVLLRSHGATT
jgi:MFS family permease